MFGFKYVCIKGNNNVKRYEPRKLDQIIGLVKLTGDVFE